MQSSMPPGCANITQPCRRVTCMLPVPRAASLEQLIANDALDQKLEAVLAPTVNPLLDYISKSPALSGAIVSLLQQYPNLLSALESAATVGLDGFDNVVLGDGNPVGQAVGQAASDNPVVDDLLDKLQELSNYTAPAVQAATVGTCCRTAVCHTCCSYRAAHAHGASASGAADSLFRVHRMRCYEIELFPVQEISTFLGSLLHGAQPTEALLSATGGRRLQQVPLMGLPVSNSSHNHSTPASCVQLGS